VKTKTNGKLGIDAEGIAVATPVIATVTLHCCISTSN